MDDVFSNVVDDGCERVFVGSFVEVECSAQEVAGGVGGKKLCGRCGVSFDEVDESDGSVFFFKEFFFD